MRNTVVVESAYALLNRAWWVPCDDPPWQQRQDPEVEARWQAKLKDYENCLEVRAHGLWLNRHIAP